MTNYSLYKLGKCLLENANIENAAFEAISLLEISIGYNRTQLFLHKDEQVIPIFEKNYFDLVERRVQGEPLQYILGKWEFMGLEFFVGKGVLIPRPETEILAELAINELQNKKKVIVFDLCAGTGCIGISVAKQQENAQVYLIENSNEAIRFLKQNIQTYMLKNTVALNGDIFNGFEAYDLPNPDIVLSNPPYIPSCELSSLQAEIKYEPEQALNGGENGLDYYIALKKLWLPHINHGGIMAVECGEDQADIISNMFSNVRNDIEILIDNNGISRVVKIKVK